MMKLYPRFALLLLVGILLGSCYKYPNDSTALSDFDVVITNHNPEMDFGQVKTYILPDTIKFIGKDLEDISADDVLFSEYVLTQIRRNMTDRNFLEVQDKDSADLQMAVGQLLLTWEVYSYFPWYGYGGYWWGYPGYGYYPPYSPTYTTYQTGSVVMDIANLTAIDNSATIPVVWSSILDGFVSSTQTSNWSRVTTAINQAYKQSPYLVTNK